MALSEALRKRHAELLALQQALRAKLEPARADYERLTNDPRLLAARQTIKAVNAELAPVEQELASLARAGGARSLRAEGAGG